MLVVCPKCGGQGHVAKPPWVPGDVPQWLDNSTGGYACPVCLGAKVLRHECGASEVAS